MNIKALCANYYYESLSYYYGQAVLSSAKKEGLRV